jgi:hypothetical protein
MPRFITIHRAPGLKPDEIAQNAPNVIAAKTAVFKQIYANLGSGFLVSVFEADNKEKLQEQMEILGFPSLGSVTIAMPKSIETCGIRKNRCRNSSTKRFLLVSRQTLRCGRAGNADGATRRLIWKAFAGPK